MLRRVAFAAPASLGRMVDWMSGRRSAPAHGAAAPTTTVPGPSTLSAPEPVLEHWPEAAEPPFVAPRRGAVAEFLPTAPMVMILDGADEDGEAGEGGKGDGGTRR